MPERFSICRKDYETPLGAAQADKDFIARLTARLDHRFSDEFSHRGEHSIEFQAVCLKYILRGNQDFRIVPVLVNSFHDIYSEGRTALEDPEIQNVVNAIRKTMDESSGRICVIAGADLAHVGRRFGDSTGPT
jgi:AmmeMemoRadiSam system protein B